MAITFEQWLDVEACECGGPVFKYHDVSKNIFILKCGLLKKTFDQKTKKYIVSKKQPCKYKEQYVDTPYDFIGNEIDVTKIKTVEDDKNKNLKERIINLFNYYDLIKKESIIQEINIIMRTRLHRKTQYIYYSPTTTPFMKEVARESIADFKKRVLSRPIVDRGFPLDYSHKHNNNTLSKTTKSVDKVNTEQNDPLEQIINEIEILTVVDEEEINENDSQSDKESYISEVEEKNSENEESNSIFPEEDGFIEDELDNFSDNEYSFD